MKELVTATMGSFFVPVKVKSEAIGEKQNDLLNQMHRIVKFT